MAEGLVGLGHAVHFVAALHRSAAPWLIERFGRPATTFEEGEFGAGFAREVAAGRLIRIAEWNTDRGVIRLGIPRRVDGAARIEIHHARAFASPRDTAWGMEAIR